MSPSNRYVIGLGANMGTPLAVLEGALRRLDRDARRGATSSPYRTPAWGVVDQADFVNAVTVLASGRSPRELLDWLLALEEESGRRRVRRWGPRILDLDLLAWSDPGTGEGRTLREPGLEVPHPGILMRPFVLAPLLEVLPDWRHPVTGTTAREAWWNLPEAERRDVRPLAWQDPQLVREASEVPALREHVHSLGLAER